MTLKQLCVSALEGIGSFEVPSTIFGNEDDTAVVLRVAAADTGRELVRNKSWQALINVGTFTTVADTTQYSKPTGFIRFANQTFWNTSEERSLVGPFTPAQWATLTRGFIADQYRYSLAVRGGYIEISPTPAAGQAIAYDYYSKQYSTDSGGTPQDNWAADDDLPRLDDDLFILGIRYRFLRRKELAFTKDEEEYYAAVEQASFDDTPKARVDLTGIPASFASNLPDGNFGV